MNMNILTKRLIITLVIVSSSQALLHSTETSDIEVISNPHDENHLKESDNCPRSCQPHLLLSPQNIIKNIKGTQTDTLITISYEKVLAVPVPIYHFRQPERLSPLQLPFKIVLVSDLAQANVYEVPVDPVAASDSWFPGYSWTPIVCVKCEDYIHVGWKYHNSNGDFFYGLIVETKVKDEIKASIGVMGDLVMESLKVGIRAPGWMIESVAFM